MKKIIFIRHALDRLNERGIAIELVKDVVRIPDSIDSKNTTRTIAQRLIDGKSLRVIYEEEEHVMVVISAYITSNVNKYQKE